MEFLNKKGLEILVAALKKYTDNAASNATYTLSTASDSVLGGIKTGYTTSGLKRAVKVDANGNAYVEQKDDDTKYTLPLAAANTRGGIQIGFTSNANDRAVQLNNEKAYVNIPNVTTGANGLMIAADKAKLDKLSFNSDGTIPTSKLQLPSYVDDVIEGTYNATSGKFVAADGTKGAVDETGKIYLDTATNKQYRYVAAAGSTAAKYVELYDGGAAVENVESRVSTIENTIKDYSTVKSNAANGDSNANKALSALAAQNATDTTSSTTTTGNVTVKVSTSNTDSKTVTLTPITEDYINSLFSANA